MEALREDPKKKMRRVERRVRRQWYSDLKLLVASLDEAQDKHVLRDDDLSQLKIRVSDLPLETDASLDFEPRFFAPFPLEYLHSSACDLLDSRTHDNTVHHWHPPPEDPLDIYYYDRGLASSIGKHVSSSRLEHGYPWGWKGVSPDPRHYKGLRAMGGPLEGRHKECCSWMVEYIFDKCTAKSPHLMMVMVSDHKGGDGLLRSEVYAIVTFMLARFGSKRRRKHVIHLMLVVSILSNHQIRILQGYFDGHLNVRCSRTIDCSTPDHEEAMNLVVQWLMSKPCGGTTIKNLVPNILVGAIDPSEDDKNDQQPQATLAILTTA